MVKSQTVIPSVSHTFGAFSSPSNRLAGTGALAARSTELVVPGFKVADLGPKFTIGSEIDGANPAHDFLALHFT